MRTQVEKPILGATGENGDISVVVTGACTHDTIVNDMRLWNTAHNVANKLDADGVDGLAAINALPKLVSELKRVRSIDNQEQRLAERGIAVMQFWKSIQGKEDERDT